MTKRLFSKLFVLTGLLLGSGCAVINSIGPFCDRSAESNPPVEYVEGSVKDGVLVVAGTGDAGPEPSESGTEPPDGGLCVNE